MTISLYTYILVGNNVKVLIEKIKSPIVITPEAFIDGLDDEQWDNKMKLVYIGVPVMLNRYQEKCRLSKKDLDIQDP